MWKRILLRLFLFLLIVAACLHAANQDSLHKTLYVENAMDAVISNSQYGRIFVLSVLNDLFIDRGRQFKNADVNEMLDYVNSRSDEIAKLNRVAESASNFKFHADTRETLQSFLKIGGELSGPLGKTVANVSSELISLGGRALDEYLGPSAQRVVRPWVTASVSACAPGCMKCAAS